MANSIGPKNPNDLQALQRPQDVPATPHRPREIENDRAYATDKNDIGGSNQQHDGGMRIPKHMHAANQQNNLKELMNACDDALHKSKNIMKFLQSKLH